MSQINVVTLSCLATQAASAWSVAHGIASGCGCTPFFADARSASCAYVAAFRRYRKAHPKLAAKLEIEYPHSQELERSTRVAARG